ncbi:MAG: V-type ATP synthase subunit E [Nitrososphaeraceae archaeon]
MTNLDNFIQEIEERKKRKIDLLDNTLFEKEESNRKTKEQTIKELKEHYENEAKAKAERERSRLIEASKLEAKKILFDAINANMDSNFNMIRQELKNYTQKPEYKEVMEKMVNYAKKRLGNDVTIYCREEDHSIFKEKKLTVGSPINTIGGLIAEDKKGTIELDLTFDELLRTNEDNIKGFLLEKATLSE